MKETKEAENETMSEDTVVHFMLAAKTEETVAHAKALARKFLKQNPDSLKVIMAGGGLHMMDTALQRIEKRRIDEAAGVKGG